MQFSNWNDDRPVKIYTEIISGVEEYIPGEFYKRELPCILSLLKQIDITETEAIIVDGFVYLDDENSLGLGAHLYQALQGEVPVIGVAKTNFASIEKNKRAVFRGESTKPLYVTAIGIDIDIATGNITKMHGDYRLPTLLKELDRLTKEL